MQELPLMEMFYTVQGEGFHQGRAAFFVRLAGCDVGCHWCDVKESWDASLHPTVSVEKITEDILETKAKVVVVTGGEPLMYDLGVLTDVLKSKGLKTHIETSGAYEPSGDWDWFCLSPKKFKSPTANAYQLADELKIIVFNRSDLQFALEESEKVRPECLLYLQPEWSKKEEMQPLMVDFVKEHPNWRIGLQSHKYLDIP